MRNRKMLLNKLLSATVVAGTLFATCTAAQASVVNGIVTPVITAGALPDSPDARIDPNTASSAFSGVVSISIQYGNEGYICSGALIGKRQVLSAGHCVDQNGDGKVIDLANPDNRVRVVFNSDGPRNAIINATNVSINPDYQGFNNCPDGSKGCVNDDISIITLGQDAPDSAKVYKISNVPLTEGTRIIMAGYGTAGDGINGHTVDPDFFVKRTGQNVVDLFDGDDEQDFTGAHEVYYADFDGNGKDAFCDFAGVCTPALGNSVEAGIGGGDSGGPSFVEMYGELVLVANNTFEGRLFRDDVPGTFGTYFGGIILSSYDDYIKQATGGAAAFVPEPGSLALLAFGGALMGLRRRRK
jgi:hypothetical protein